MKPARNPEKAHEALLQRRQEMIDGVAAALHVCHGLLTESLTPHEARKRHAHHRATLEKGFSQSIATLVTEVGALPPAEGALRRAMTLEASALHLLRDIGAAVEEALPAITGRFDEAVAGELGKNIELLMKGFKTLPTIGTNRKRSSRLRESLTVMMTTAKSRMDQDHDSLSSFHLWMMLFRIASNTLWIVEYYTYIETGEWQDRPPVA